MKFEISRDSDIDQQHRKHYNVWVLGRKHYWVDGREVSREEYVRLFEQEYPDIKTSH